MNQIPNIEETYNTREVEEVVKEFYKIFDTDNLWQGEDEWTKNVPIGNIEQWLRTTLHHQLQKAREEEKMGILKIALTMGDCPINNPKADAGWMKFQHDFCLKLTKDNKKSILSETDHSELDQDELERGLVDKG